MTLFSRLTDLLVTARETASEKKRTPSAAVGSTSNRSKAANCFP